MNITIKKILAFSLMTLLLISFSGIASARKTMPVWEKGEVTKAAWKEGNEKYIEVDSERYIFLPDDRAKITRQYKAPNGQWYSESFSLDKVYIGTKVLIRVIGMEIHQLIVEEP
jgi:hypothetical protein